MIFSFTLHRFTLSSYLSGRSGFGRDELSFKNLPKKGGRGTDRMKEKDNWLRAKLESVQRKSGWLTGSTGFLVKVVLLLGWRAQEPPLQLRGWDSESHRMHGTVGAMGQQARMFCFEVCLSGSNSWWESYILCHFSSSLTSTTCCCLLFIKSHLL